MAGEKLSPRQKMIGMMYLVLTALLALQVSSSVLEKFVLISNSIDENIAYQKNINQATIERIKSVVKELGSRKGDVSILDKAVEVNSLSDKVISYIENLKQTLIKNSGGIAKNGIIKGLKNDGVVATLMLTNKKAEELKNMLDNYVQKLSDISGNKYRSIALDAKDIGFLKNDPNQHNKKFDQLNFQKTPLAAALATLSNFQSSVIYLEADALEGLARSVGAKDMKFDTVLPMIRPDSNIVAAGLNYKAELFLTAYSSSVSPEMFINGKKIDVKGGIGIVNFPATSSTYDNSGMARKTFQASIKMKMPGGTETTINKEIEYFVAKPLIQVQSASVQALYLNCGNELNIQVPNLGNNYNPKFTVEGGIAIPGGAKGLVTIVPSESKVKLNVYSDSNFLGSQDFRVRRIPKPDIVITSQGKPIDEKIGYTAPGPRDLEVKVVPDLSFKEFLPKDARYRVKEWSIILARGSRPIKQENFNNMQKVNLNSIAALAKPGDRLVIEIKKIERLNFKEEIESVDIGTIIKTIPLN
jgi:gliding motility-associated protein GldM